MRAEELAHTSILRLAGELDLGTIGRVLAAADRVDVDRVALLVLDLRDLDFIDVTGLRSVLRINERFAAQGIQVTVIKPSGFASRVFTLTRAHEELDLVDSV